jgi:hypothetical protein
LPSPATVSSVFGNSPTANLDVSLYDNSSTGWIMYRREVSTTPSSYVKLPSTDSLSTGFGYWLRSLSAPVGGKLVVDGNATLAPVTTGGGCASANGCAAVRVQTVSGQNRYNLVGNPFPYNVDWSKVRVRVTGGTNPGVFTPSEAQTAGYLSNTIWIWTGSGYGTWSDTEPTKGNLKYAQSFWVNVLSGAAGLTVELLIPAEASTLGQTVAPLERLWAAARTGAGWVLESLIASAAADDLDPGRAPGREGARAVPPAPVGTDPALELLVTEGVWSQGLEPEAAEAAAQERLRVEGRAWSVRLTISEPATGFRDDTSLLGQWPGAQNGYDAGDLIELQPFASPYLTLVFPHPEWAPRAWAFASDLRSPQKLNARGRPVAVRPAANWDVEIRADAARGGEVVLTWEGPAEILARSRLRDRDTGKTIQPSAARYTNGYRLRLTSSTRRLTWQFLGQ